MADPYRNQYIPDYASPPGDTLREILEMRGMPQARLARLLGMPVKTVNKIVKGKALITNEMAVRLERVFDVPASFWNEREREYREALARIKGEKKLA